MRFSALLLWLLPAGVVSKPVHHYVFFGGDREQIRTDSAFLATKSIEGAQILYTWRLLEPSKDGYNFTPIREDLEFLRSHGKKLFIQLQEVTFDSTRINVPRYLLNDSAYHGGVARQYTNGSENDSIPTPSGWVARRWDPAVQERFYKLLTALGKEFDGKIEGINLPETSLVMGPNRRFHPEGFTFEKYRDAIIANMRVFKRAFPTSVAMQYANFMPGEWRATSDKGYLTSVYAAAKELKVAVGGPDVMPSRTGQMTGPYPLIREAAGTVPTGLAVQDGNLAEINPKTGKKVTAAELLRFAVEDLKLDYLFWGREEPYYSAEVIPVLRAIR